MSKEKLEFPNDCLALVKCHDCSEFLCTDCREPHLRETFFNITSSVTQLRRTLPRLSEKVASHEQRVNAVRTNYDQIRRDISMNISALIDELKHRENTLILEAESQMQSQLRYLRRLGCRLLKIWIVPWF